METQSFSVKRAEVEFQRFASFGEPERVIRVYEEENYRRGGALSEHLRFIEPITPFLEIGAATGHTSYMLVNDFGGEGFALDLSVDALRYGRMLMDRWRLDGAPVRVAGDACKLPFADNSLRLVLACQMLSQFMDIEAIFVEVKRVLQPGGVFVFLAEPIRRTLSLRLYRLPYEEQMKPWERKLHEWGLLGYLAKDVIGAQQEESFGIRQNHSMSLKGWHALVQKHFVASEYDIFAPERGWGERVVKSLARKYDRLHSEWAPARLLGGTLSAYCRKAGEAPQTRTTALALDFEALLRCPDCRGTLRRDAAETLLCTSCAYQSPHEDGVYNLLPSADKKELYPGARRDVIDFSLGPQSDRLIEGFYKVEGVYGNKYRWIARKAAARLEAVNAGPHKLRVRGHAMEKMLSLGEPAKVQIRVNGGAPKIWTLDRPGLFLLEMPLEEAREYVVEVSASPSFRVPPDKREFTVTLSMLRLVDAG